MKFLWSLIIGLMCFVVQAQNSQSPLRKPSISVSYLFGKSDIQKPDYDQINPVINKANYNGVGVYFLYPITRNNRLELEAGLEYTSTKIEFEKSAPNFINTFDSWYIPLAVRLNFLKYFFMNMGTYYGFTISDYGGLKIEKIYMSRKIGFTMGIAFQLKWKNYSFYANPGFRWYELLSVDQYFRLGVTYRFK